jgi:5-deoxy-glucuronate isomerase
VTATAATPCSVAVITTAGAGLEATGGDPVFVEAGDEEIRGHDEWERTVITLIDPSSCGSRRLIAGQTTHASGGWSSYPPHRHDGSGEEPYFEEIYHYRFEPPTGFGFQALYADDGLSEASLIRDGDTLTIERGYHPVCAAPGHRFTYLWALCGPAERFEPVDDPVHAWVSAG